MRALDPKLPLIQRAPLDGKVVLIRFDHNVVKKGKIKDPTGSTGPWVPSTSIVDHGAKPILMTHVGRPVTKRPGDFLPRRGVGETHCRVPGAQAPHPICCS